MRIVVKVFKEELENDRRLAGRESADKDSTISSRNAEIAGLTATIKEMAERLPEKDSVISERDAEIARLKAVIEKMAVRIGHQDIIIASNAGKIAQLNEQIGELQVSLMNGPPGNGQFRKLRALTIKELHPDYAPADSVDRALRAEAFKAIWPKIEALSTEA